VRPIAVRRAAGKVIGDGGEHRKHHAPARTKVYCRGHQGKQAEQKPWAIQPACAIDQQEIDSRSAKLRAARRLGRLNLPESL
jgi:hypothetical protein